MSFLYTVYINKAMLILAVTTHYMLQSSAKQVPFR